MRKRECAPWYGCRVCYPDGGTPIQRVLTVASEIEAARRVSPDLASVWAGMAGQQETPRVCGSEGLTTSTDSESASGCKTDGA
jgi:hypothetical protein